MAVAVELLDKKGFDAVTADDIAEGADVGRRTFYNYFEGKGECVIAAVRARFEGYAQSHAARITNLFSVSDADSPDADNGDVDYADVVASMASAMFHSIANDPITEKLTAHPHILNSAITESQRDFLTANIANGVMTGRFQPMTSPDIAEPITSWGFIGLVIASIGRQSQAQDGIEWARFILTMIGLSHEEINAISFFKGNKK